MNTIFKLQCAEAWAAMGRSTACPCCHHCHDEADTQHDDGHWMTGYPIAVAGQDYRVCHPVADEYWEAEGEL